MTSLVSSWIASGHTRFGPPPVAMFKFTRVARVESGGASATVADIFTRLDPDLDISGLEKLEAGPELFAGVVLTLLRAAGHTAASRPPITERFEETALAAIPVEEGESALRAGELAIALLEEPTGTTIDEWRKQLATFVQFASERIIDSDARRIRRAAARCGLPAMWLDQEPFEPMPPSQPMRYGLQCIGYGCAGTAFAGAMPGGADDRMLEAIRCRSTLMPHLAAAGIPVPAQDPGIGTRNSLPRTLLAAERIGYPVDVKALYKPYFPHRSSHPDQFGPLYDPDQVAAAYKQLARKDRRVWVEKSPLGERYRFLIIGGTVRAVSKLPHTRSNHTDADRNVHAAVSMQVSAELASLAERAARHCRLHILSGVDMAIVDPLGNASADNAIVTNVLPDPDLSRHSHGDEEDERSIATQLMQYLYPEPANARIPILAVTGTNGKTTTSRMLQRILRGQHARVGLATTEGAWLNDELVLEGDVAGVTGGAMVLSDLRSDAAVLETARGGLMKFGTIFDFCDVAACLNISSDHVGADGIETLEQMAEVKGRLLETARSAVVINADDRLSLGMRERAACDRHVLVSEADTNTAMAEHRKLGGESAWYGIHDGREWLILAKGEQEFPLMPASEIAATMNGLLKFNRSNALFAAAIAWAGGVQTEHIRQALKTFSNSPDDNPGRYNFIEGYPFEVLTDFAHNPEGVQGVLEVIRGLGVQGQLHLVCLTIGARHRIHINQVVEIFARMFETIQLGSYRTNVERNPEWSGDDPHQTMLDYFRKRMIEAGHPENRLGVYTDRAEAIKAGLAAARPGDLLLVLSPPDVALPVLTKASVPEAAAPESEVPET